MGFSSTLLPHFPASFRRHYFKFCPLRVHEGHRTLSFVTTTKCCALHGTNSIVGNRKSSINSNGTPEPATALLERLFVQTQKLEEHMIGNSHFFQDVESDLNLKDLESDLEAALKTLKKKEEDLQEAERMVMLEHAELNQAREELEGREKEIAAACSKQEELEDELRKANLKLISQARYIEDLKLKLKERDQEVTAAESALLLKQDEIDKMRCELTQKNEEVARTEAQLIAKAQLLNEANDVVKRQDIELRELRNSLQGKQQEIEELLNTKQLETEKLKDAETKLEKQTMEWLLAQEDLKKLGEEASKHIEESQETIKDFQRVKRLLANVRSELVSSQNSLATSRQKMKEQELVLEKQLLELEEQKETIVSYMSSLKSAQAEIESERAKLRVAEAQNKEFELDLSLKRDLLRDLQGGLNKEKYSLQKAIKEVSSLREDLNKKNSEFEKTNSLLEVKEKELVDAKLEIQHLISEQKSLQLTLQERDLELSTAKKRLEEVNAEVAELKMLLNMKEDQLILATGMLKEKDDYTEAMQHELVNARLKASEAETVVGRIVDLTNKLVISTNDDEARDLGEYPSQLFGKPVEDFRLQKTQLEAELELTKENLKVREMELLGAQRELAIKEEELEKVIQSLEVKDRELKELKEEGLRDADSLKTLSTMAKESAGQQNVDDFAIEKLQLEAAQLEVEAATSALHKLAELSRELLHKASLSFDADHDVNVFPQNDSGPKLHLIEDSVPLQHGFDSDSDTVKSNECITEIKTEVARLSALTERPALISCKGI
ncbi:myosin-9-like isoform X2 [Chenopodium quinoa]|uniref:myosin-9-like isoform X2 n=1 Tax=Chenopodium quinoa TaxID=63459 RepID=UPI000B783555|nr:myosin-9-like isoform X2 [Chenopodium quinoa]